MKQIERAQKDFAKAIQLLISAGENPSAKTKAAALRLAANALRLVADECAKGRVEIASTLWVDGEIRQLSKMLPEAADVMAAMLDS